MEKKFERMRIIKEHNYSQNKMTKALHTLYSAHWCDYKEQVQSRVECAMPFLLVPTNEYCASERKIMIVGQETDSWGGEVYDFPEEQTPDNVMNVYDRFVNRGGYNSPYWDFIREIKDAAPSNTNFVINNVVKIGKKSDVGCDDNINTLTLQYFHLFQDELKILKPDMILFLTGPYYDHRIKAAFGEFKLDKVISELRTREFAKIQFVDNEMPTAYRCYHPAYLRRSRNFARYLEIISNIINS